MNYLCVDAILHPDLPVIVWLMIHKHQNPNFIPSSTLLSFILHIVYDLATIKYRDSVFSAIARMQSLQPPGVNAPKKIPIPTARQLQSLANQPAATLVKSLLIRASYGGMKGDMKMLQSLATIWFASRDDCCAELLLTRPFCV